MGASTALPEMFEWLLDHGANMELREQDYGATPLTGACHPSPQKGSSGFWLNEARYHRHAHGPRGAWLASES